MLRVCPLHHDTVDPCDHDEACERFAQQVVLAEKLTADDRGEERRTALDRNDESDRRGDRDRFRLHDPVAGHQSGRQEDDLPVVACECERCPDTAALDERISDEAQRDQDLHDRGIERGGDVVVREDDPVADDREAVEKESEEDEPRILVSPDILDELTTFPEMSGLEDIEPHRQEEHPAHLDRRERFAEDQKGETCTDEGAEQKERRGGTDLEVSDPARDVEECEHRDHCDDCDQAERSRGHCFPRGREENRRGEERRDEGDDDAEIHRVQTSERLLLHDRGERGEERTEHCIDKPGHGG